MITRSLSVVVALLVATWSGITAQTTPVATYKEGHASFTQGGREVTWTLYQGRAEDVPAAGNMRTASLMYTPDGRYGQAILRVSVGKMTVSGNVVIDLSVLAVEHGPAGDAIYRMRRARCTVTVTKLDAQGAEGSGACTGEFERGPAISKFRFTAGP